MAEVFISAKTDGRSIPRLRRLGLLCVRCQRDRVWRGGPYPNARDAALDAWLQSLPSAFCLFCSCGVPGDGDAQKRVYEERWRENMARQGAVQGKTVTE